MGNVGPVVTFALHDEGLGPDHLLRRAEQDGTAQDAAGCGVSEPEVVHRGDAVPRTEDDIDEAISRIYLCEPVRERQLGHETRGLECGPRRPPVLLAEKYVQVLRVSHDTGVRGEGMSAPDQELYACPLERQEYPKVRVPDTRVEHVARRERGEAIGLCRSHRKIGVHGACPSTRSRLVRGSREETVHNLTQLSEPERLLEVARR